MRRITQIAMDAYEQERNQINARASKSFSRLSYIFAGSLCLGAGLFGHAVYKAVKLDPPPSVQTYNNAKETLSILEAKQKILGEGLPYRTEELDRYMVAIFPESPSYLDSAISIVRNDIALMKAADEIKTYEMGMKKNSDSINRGAAKGVEILALGLGAVLFSGLRTERKCRRAIRELDERYGKL